MISVLRIWVKWFFELIKKVIEFDQSIETNFREREREREREKCAANGLRFFLFLMRRKWRQHSLHSSPFCFITLLLPHHSSNQNNPSIADTSLFLWFQNLKNSPAYVRDSYLELYRDRLVWDFYSMVTCFEIQKNFVVGLGSLLNYMALCSFNWAIIIKIWKLI